jgi:Autotransporter beta-domain
MGQRRYARSIATVVALTSVAVIVGAVSQSAQATWYDSSTGQPVHVTPRGPLNEALSNHAVFGGHDVYWDDACHTWRDSANGQEVHVIPPGPLNEALSNHAVFGGHDVYWEPCPPPQTAMSTGLYLGGELVKNWGWVRSTERLAATDTITNQFTDRADPFGGGFVVGYNFMPWHNILVGPFGSFDFMRAPVNHTFANGNFLGTTGNFIGTAGVKVGPSFNPGVWVYGIVGVSVLNETLNVNFAPTASSANATVPGATIGAGVAWKPSVLQGFGRPVSLFLDYEHTWWQSANFNTPASSPGFNYNFQRQEDVIKFGFTVSLYDPGGALPPPIIHK